MVEPYILKHHIFFGKKNPSIHWIIFETLQDMPLVKTMKPFLDRVVSLLSMNVTVQTAQCFFFLWLAANYDTLLSMILWSNHLCK